MTEADMNERIGQWLYSMPRIMGYHHPDSRRATLKGFPDWVFIGPRGILYRELKGSEDVLSPEQRRVGRQIMMAGGDWRVWWPGDIARGVAESELAAIALGEDYLATITDDDGRKKHVCDEKCQRICAKCLEDHNVHGMWRWAVQSVVGQARLPQGTGGLICDGCAHQVLTILHAN